MSVQSRMRAKLSHVGETRDTNKIRLQRAPMSWVSQTRALQAGTAFRLPEQLPSRAQAEPLLPLLLSLSRRLLQQEEVPVRWLQFRRTRSWLSREGLRRRSHATAVQQQPREPARVLPRPG